MKHFLLTVLGTLVAMFLFFFLIILFFISLGMAATMGSQSQTSAGDYVLTLDLRESLLDHSAGESLFGGVRPSVVEIVRSLHAAKSDDDIQGLFIRANGWSMTPATAEEIRLAIKDFKSSGKFVITHAQGFEGTSLMPYMAVSASDQIWLQDTTSFSSAGIRSEVGFYKGVFDKLDAKPQIVQFHEYKSAANVYMETDFTDAHRESTKALLVSLYDTAVDHIAEDRGLSTDEVNRLLQGAPHTAESAKAAGLIDTLGHLIEAQEAAKDKAGGDHVRFLNINSYEPDSFTSGSTIAFVGGQGPVLLGKSSDASNPFSNDITMGGDTVSSALMSAAKDKSVKAIIFRVSSPGGSATASDQIYHAVNYAKEAGKPVIISMGKYAASGGYYVAANADRIVAMPTTITGSIGVLGGKIALRDTFEKIGYNVEDVNVGGEYVSAYSGDEPFTQAQYAAFRDQMGEIYSDFTTKVAEGRDLPLDRVLDVAKGRVWTGEQAQGLGLVDELGGFMKTIEVAKEVAEIDADTSVRLKMFPRPKTTQEQIQEMFNQASIAREELKTIQEIRNLPEVEALLKARNHLQPHQELLANIPDIQ